MYIDDQGKKVKTTPVSKENETPADDLGIGNAKPLARDIGELLTQLINIDANHDDKITAMEAFAIVQLVTVKIVTRFNTFKDAFDELKDADGFERNDLITELAATFKMENETAEKLIEAWLYWINEVSELIANTVSILKTEK